MSCSIGFISIVDSFLNPDSSDWTGSITYTLLYATTAAGATLIQARQNINVSDGIDICMAPGLYNVTYNQSGQDYPVSAQWNVPSSGGPYTIAAISSGTFPPPEAAGSTGEVQFNSADVFAADSTFTFSSTTKALTLSGATVGSTFAGHLIGASQTSIATNGRYFAYIGTNSPGGNGTVGVNALKVAVAQNDDVTNPTSATIVSGEFSAVVNAGCTSNWTSGASTPGGLGAMTGVRASVTHLGTGILSKVSGIRSAVGGNATGNVIDAALYRAIGPQAASLFTTLVGFKVETMSAAATIANNYGVLVDSLDVGTNRYAFYSAGALDKVHIEGDTDSPGRLSLTATPFNTSAFAGHMVGAAQTSVTPSGADLLYIGAGVTGSNGTSGVIAAKATAVANEDATVLASASLRAMEFLTVINSGSSGAWTAGASSPGGLGAMTGGRATVSYLGTGSASKISGFRAAISGNGTGTVIDGAGMRIIPPQSAQNFTSYFGVKVEATSASSAATIANAYGVYVDTLQGVSKWAFYAASDKSYFGGQIQLPLTTPASSSATGVAGTVQVDANYIYVCTATDTWKRVPLSAF